MNPQLESIVDDVWSYIAVMLFLSIQAFGLGLCLGLLW